MTGIEQAKKRLLEGDFTCVLLDGEREYTSALRGVRPLLQWVEEGVPSGLWAADRVVGRGAAFLYILLHVRAVYAGVISRPALATLQAAGIEVIYTALVDAIINRAGDGICPFEAAVTDISDPNEALCAIRRKMAELRIT